MTRSQLSASSQNYLKAVWTLAEWSDAPVTASTLAAKIGVKLSTASDAVRKLAAQGLLVHAPYGAVSLTEEGREAALAMVRRHRLVEAFLVEVLAYRADQVHDEAEVLEHAVSDFMIDRIDERLGHPTRDPHGDPIPDADGVLPRCASRCLADLLVDEGAGGEATSGGNCRVERISDEDPRLVLFLAEKGIAYGARLSVLEIDPLSEVIRVRAEGSAPVSLGLKAARAVRVSLG